LTELNGLRCRLHIYSPACTFLGSFARKKVQSPYSCAFLRMGTTAIMEPTSRRSLGFTNPEPFPPVQYLTRPPRRPALLLGPRIPRERHPVEIHGPLDVILIRGGVQYVRRDDARNRKGMGDKP
jgi:hypothetical protein